MALTDAQITTLAQKRKRNPPSYYNSDTGSSQGISSETEDALILAPSSVKQKAAQYLDLLLDANPQKSDYDTILARAATKNVALAEAVATELQPVIENFEAFRRTLLGGGETDSFYYNGMQPLFQALLRGIGPIRNKVKAREFYRRLDRVAAAKHGSNLTDATRKEWRSWKRVLLAYP